MDVISYGVANKAAKQEKDTRNNVLGVGIEGSFSHARARIDNLETALQGVVGQADKLIVNDAINIMKANAKFNAVAKTLRYKHQNMVFEDFLDAAGIDAGKSSGYTLDTTNGLVKASGAGNYTVITTVENADAIPEKAILVVEEYAPAYTNNLIPPMTADDPSKVSIGGGSIIGLNFRAFDGKWAVANQEGWASNNADAWIAYEFSTEKVIQKYVIYPFGYVNDQLSVNPSTWYFEAWNGSAWITLHSKVKVTDWAINQKKEFTFSNSTPYRKYRLRMTASTHAANYKGIGEIEMMESAPSGTTQGSYSISRDGGITFEPITPETLFYFTDSISPKDTKLVLKAELPSNVQLLNYGLTWS